MDYEVYEKIRRGKANALRTLQEEELPWSWFVCYYITNDSGTAAELLRQAWKSTIEKLLSLHGCPMMSFKACLSEELYRLSDTALLCNDMFSSIPAPAISKEFDIFIEGFMKLEFRERRIYLLNRFGGLGNGEFSEIFKIPLYEAKEYLYSLERKARPAKSGGEFSDYFLISNEFKSTNKWLFENILLPDLFIKTLEHDYIICSYYPGIQPRLPQNPVF